MAGYRFETKVGWLIALTLVAVSFGGMVELVPLVAERNLIDPLPGLEPYDPIELEGRDVYIREGCSTCHTQMVRALHAETKRYGHYSVAGEDVYEHPFLWGSKRTGPDLARIGGRYSDAWHRAHLYDPRALVPASNMPAYPWLFDRTLTGEYTARKMQVLKQLGVPYNESDIANAEQVVRGVRESDALIRYLQTLGRAMADQRTDS